MERAAAAQVLSGERSRFKRVVSKRLGEGRDSRKTDGSKKSKNKNSQQEQEQQQQQQRQPQEPVLISVGGFKAMDQSVAVTREVADFCRVVAGVKRAAAAAAVGVAAGYGGAAGAEDEGAGSALARAGLFEPAFLLILHSLEVRLAKKSCTEYINSYANAFSKEVKDDHPRVVLPPRVLAYAMRNPPACSHMIARDVVGTAAYAPRSINWTATSTAVAFFSFCRSSRCAHVLRTTEPS